MKYIDFGDQALYRQYNDESVLEVESRSKGPFQGPLAEKLNVCAAPNTLHPDAAAQFFERCGFTQDQFTGRTPIEESVRIMGRDIVIPPDFNPHVMGFLEISWAVEIPNDFNAFIYGALVLDCCTKVGARFTPTVGFDLNMRLTNEIGPGFAPRVRGDIFLTSITELPEDFSPECRCLYLTAMKTLPASLTNKADYIANRPSPGTFWNLTPNSKLPLVVHVKG